MQTQAGWTHLSFQVWPNTAAAAAALHSATSSTLLLNFMDLIFLITWHRAVLCCWGHVMACDFIMTGTLPLSAASLWHGHSKLWMINCNEMKFLFAACSPRPRRERWGAENISSAVQWRFWFNTRKLICIKSAVTPWETLLVSCMLPDFGRNAPGWAEDKTWVRL